MQNDKLEFNLQFPEKLIPILYGKARHKILYGGRGSGKSYGIADFLISQTACSKKRVLCTREYQTSIRDSVHKILKDRINVCRNYNCPDVYNCPGICDDCINFSKFFIVKNDSILSIYGSEFIFKGLAHKTEEIKSTEGIDLCWVEEAEKVSQNSWDVLTPTIRKENSEILISFNPDDEKSPTYQQFVVDEPYDCLRAKVNYSDNPFFPEVLRREMEYCRKFNFEKYEHVWLGRPKEFSEALIFKGKYRVEDFSTTELVPERFWFGCDWGFSNDPTVLLRFFIKDRKLYIDYEAYEVGVELEKIRPDEPDLTELFDRIPESRKWEIKADCSRPELISHMQRKGFHIIGAPKWENCVKDRIDFIKSFEEIIIHPRCEKTKDDFSLYHYKIDKPTGKVLPIIVKGNDHSCDALGYGLSDFIQHDISILDLV